MGLWADFKNAVRDIAEASDDGQAPRFMRTMEFQKPGRIVFYSKFWGQDRVEGTHKVWCEARQISGLPEPQYQLVEVYVESLNKMFLPEKRKESAVVLYEMNTGRHVFTRDEAMFLLGELEGVYSHIIDSVAEARFTNTHDRAHTPFHHINWRSKAPAISPPPAFAKSWKLTGGFVDKKYGLVIDNFKTLRPVYHLDEAWSAAPTVGPSLVDICLAVTPNRPR
jgi:hypothetical protein